MEQSVEEQQLTRTLYKNNSESFIPSEILLSFIGPTVNKCHNVMLST